MKIQKIEGASNKQFGLDSIEITKHNTPYETGFDFSIVHSLNEEGNGVTYLTVQIAPGKDQLPEVIVLETGKFDVVKAVHRWQGIINDLSLGLIDGPHSIRTLGLILHDKQTSGPETGYNGTKLKGKFHKAEFLHLVGKYLTSQKARDFLPAEAPALVVQKLRPAA